MCENIYKTIIHIHTHIYRIYPDGLQVLIDAAKRSIGIPSAQRATRSNMGFDGGCALQLKISTLSPAQHEFNLTRPTCLHAHTHTAHRRRVHRELANDMYKYNNNRMYRYETSANVKVVRLLNDTHMYAEVHAAI